MKRSTLSLLLTFGSLLWMTGAGNASEAALFSFQDSSEMARWKSVHLSPPLRQPSERFAMPPGVFSFRLVAPAWKAGQPEWPTWRADRLNVSDWSGYDRLLLEMVNPTEHPQLVGIKVADEETSSIATAHWAGTKVLLPPLTHERAQLPLSTMLKGMLKDRLDPTQMKTLLLYATRPPAPFEFHLVKATLLKPGEALPPLSGEWVSSMRALRLSVPIRRVDEALAEVAKSAALTQPWAAARQAGLRQEAKELLEQANSATGDVEALAGKLDTLALQIRRLPSLAKLEIEEGGYAVAWASPMVKVLPRDMPLDGVLPQKVPTVSLARREHESIQLVVVAMEKHLDDVRVEAGSFKMEDGTPLPDESLHLSTVGFVKTGPAAYDRDYSGWWPDPLLDFLPSVAVTQHEAQSFWLRVHAREGQKPGIYRGEVKVSVSGAPATVRQLAIHVRDFTLPAVAPIPVSIPAGTASYFKAFSSQPWEKLKYQVADFQADYLIGWDNLYVFTPPDWEVLEYQRKQGRLQPFTLYPLGLGGVERQRLKEMHDQPDGDAYRSYLAKIKAEIAPVYAEAKRRNLLDQARFYGMDEVPLDFAGVVQRVARDLKEAFPGVPVATTTADFDYGLGAKEDAIDIWIPLLHEYDPLKAQKARERGKKVWWYNCKTPAHPYPNQFTEYPAIELRLLHGAMSARFQPDGFLYYCLFRLWTQPGTPKRTAVDHGPYTNWEPCALAFTPTDRYNGEGYLAYPGPDGRPLASIRLENFRDGFEDLHYWKLLEAAVVRVEAEGEQTPWLEAARKALKVPDSLVKSPHEFTLEPERVIAWRDQIATLLETQPKETTP